MRNKISLTALRVLYYLSKILIVPSAILLGLWLFNIVNPMTIGFLYPFSIYNETDQDILVTPIGLAGNRYVCLPLFEITPVAFPSFVNGKMLIAKGETIQLVYDWDDINFSDILVRGLDGKVRTYVVDSNPGKNQYHTPDRNLFSIRNLRGLPLASVEMERLFNKTRYQVRMWMLFIIPTFIIAIFFSLRHERK